MKPRVILLDVNGQKASSIELLIDNLDIINTRTIMIFGVSGFVSSWSRKIIQVYPAIECIPLQSDALKSSSLIMSVGYLFQTIANRPHHFTDAELVIISKTDGFKSLKPLLSDLNITEFAYFPAFNNDLLASHFLNNSEAVATLIKRVAIRHTCPQRRKPVLIATIANKSIIEMPELRSKEFRKFLFGSDKFSVICDQIGLKTEGNSVVKFD